MNKVIMAYFSSDGTPATSLLPVINVYTIGNVPGSVLQPIGTSDYMDGVGAGWYRYIIVNYNPALNYVYTIDGGATLSVYDRYKHGGNESYVEDITSGVLGDPLINHTTDGSLSDVVQRIKADTTMIAVTESTIVLLLQLLLKYQRNRTRIDTEASQLIIYDDDGVTPLTTFDLKDFNGMPNIQEVCERVPQSSAP